MVVNADNVYVSNEIATSTAIQPGDIIVVVRNGSRSLIGKHAVVKHRMNAVIGAFMTGIRTDQASFVNPMLDSRQFGIEIQKNLGATINQITTGNFKKMVFQVPTNQSERAEIGKLFDTLDDTIALHQRMFPTVRGPPSFDFHPTEHFVKFNLMINIITSKNWRLSYEPTH